MVLPAAVQEELCMAMSLLPLCFTDLRMETSPVVGAADASLRGGALCYSTGLTAEGQAALRRYAAPRNLASGEEVLLLSLVDGIGAVAEAWRRLGLGRCGYASCETDPAACRVLWRAATRAPRRPPRPVVARPRPGRCASDVC